MSPITMGLCMFQKGVGFRVWEGNIRVCFLVNDWRVYLRLYWLASNKLSSIKDCYEGEGSFVSWACHIEEFLCQLEQTLIELLSILLFNVFLYKFEVDSRL